MLIPSTITAGVHYYEFGAEGPYSQDRYAGEMPWQYLSTLCAVMFRRVRASQSVFFVRDLNAAIRDAPLQRSIACCASPGEVKDASNDLVLTTSEGVLLYPTTRDGLESASLLYWTDAGRWCRLVRDLGFRDRVLRSELTAEAMLEECGREWIAEIRPGHDTFEIAEGPRFAHLSDLLSRCIDEANEDYS